MFADPAGERKDVLHFTRLLAGLVLLSACQADPSAERVLADAAPLADMRSWAFRCPPAGAVMQNTLGGSFRYDGADPADPVVCRSRVSDTVYREPYGLIPSSVDNDLSSRRRTLARLFPAVPGNVSRGIFTLASGNETYQYDERWSVVGFERITVPAGTFQTVVLEHRQEGMGGNTHLSTRRLWLDTASGVPVKQTVHLVRGFARSRNWEATRIDLPGRIGAAAVR